MINAHSHLKMGIMLVVIIFMALALLLWTQTPDLFDYFNQAFCPH